MLYLRKDECFFPIRFIKQDAVGFLLLFSLSCLRSVVGPVSEVTNLIDPPEKSDRYINLRDRK